MLKPDWHIELHRRKCEQSLLNFVTFGVTKNGNELSVFSEFQDNQVIGVGSGSTIVPAIQHLGRC